MNLSVVIPVHNGGEELRRCLKALETSARSPDEVIVVDDASTDETRGVAEAWGARVLSLSGRPRGPALARNRGVAVARGDVIVFIDADVAVHRETLGLIDRCLIEHSEIAALFGSYDDDPPEPGVATRFKNLLHHYTHQHSRREASTFWAGCGAIRRDVFSSLGGFDESYACPSVEDIELGARLRRCGYRVWLCPEIQVTHLKRWRLTTLLRADIFDRAVPWTRLILSSAQLPSDLNLDFRSRLSAIAAWAGLAFLALSVRSAWMWIGSLMAMAALGALNAGLYRFFIRHGGVRFAVSAFGLHALYFLYSSAVFVILFGLHLPRKVGREIREMGNAAH